MTKDETKDFTATKKLHDSAPMKANGALGMIDKLLDDVIKNPSLQTDSILKTNSVFQSDVIIEGTVPLSSIEQLLLDSCIKLNTYLCDILIHVNLLELNKVESNSDFDAISSFKKDVDVIQQRLVSVGFDIAEFHNKHDSTLMMKNTIFNDSKQQRQSIISAHKSWIIYQITFLKSSMETIRRLYRLLMKG